MFCNTEKEIMPVAMGNNDGFMSGYGFWAILIFFALLVFGGGGWFGNRGNGFDGSALASTIGNLVSSFTNGRSIAADYTDSAVQRGFDTQEILGKLDAINSGNCNNTAALNNAINGVGMGMVQGFNGIGMNMMQGFNGVQAELCQGFGGVNMAIAQQGYQNQLCCCETQKEIAASRYEAARNTCDIVNAIRDDGNATRALITQTEMQNLRDKLADRDRDIQSRDFQLSQLSQTRTLVNELRPCPIPAYGATSPYQSFGPFGVWNGCGNGYGYNNGCGCGSCA